MRTKIFFYSSELYIIGGLCWKELGPISGLQAFIKLGIRGNVSHFIWDSRIRIRQHFANSWSGFLPRLHRLQTKRKYFTYLLKNNPWSKFSRNILKTFNKNYCSHDFSLFYYCVLYKPIWIRIQVIILDPELQHCLNVM